MASQQYIQHCTWNSANSSNWTINYAPAAAAVEAQEQEQDVAQRQNFTFPYTGDEIAAALSRKIQAVTDRVTALHSLDGEALALLYDLERNTDLSKRVELEVKEQQKVVEKLVAERAPYAKAGKQKFDLDLEDIAHFGLDAEDAPARKTRKPREKKAEAPLVASAGGAAG